MKRIIILTLIFLISLSIVNAIVFKNAIKLDEGWNDFGIRLNDSFEVTGDINKTLINSGSGVWNYIGYSSKTSINVDNIVFYKADGTSDTYQNAKTNGWINAINLSNGSFTIGSGSGEPYTLKEYDAFWLKSFLAVKMKFPSVGGSNISGTIHYDDITFFNGTNYLNSTEANSEGWITQVGSGVSIIFWYYDYFFGIIRSRQIPEHKTALSTWEGYHIYANKPNIYLLFENTTVQRPYRFGINCLNKFGAGTKRCGMNGRWNIPELVTNGGFDTDSDWINGAWTIADDVASCVNCGFGDDLEQDIGVEAGKTYQLTFEVTAYTGGKLRPFIGNTLGTIREATGNYTENIIASNTDNLEFRARNANPFTGSIDDVSVKQIAPKRFGIRGFVNENSFS